MEKEQVFISVLFVVILIVGGWYLFFTPDPLRMYSDYPSIGSTSIDKIKSFEVGEDKTLIQKEIGDGYETIWLNEKGVWESTVVYKKIENKSVRLIEFYFTGEKLSSIEIVN